MASFRNKLNAVSENAIQEAIFDHLRQRRASDVFAFHPKNGGVHQSSKAQRALNAKRGVVSGVPDIIAIKDGQTYALELKAGDNKPTPEQISTMQEMQRCGGIVAVATGLDQALAKLEEWGLVKGASS